MLNELHELILIRLNRKKIPVADLASDLSGESDYSGGSRRLRCISFNYIELCELLDETNK